MRILFLFVAVLFGVNLKGQLHISTDVPPDTMIMDFFNTASATVSNVDAEGAAISYFEGALTDLGLNAGIFMSTGDPFTAVGVNDSEGTSLALGTPGDDDLSLYTTAQTFDASIISMDLVAMEDTLAFQYVFASEEYEEWVGSTFNDVFAFLVREQGDSLWTNITLLPDQTPVTVNNVNQNINAGYYRDGIEGITFDGFTTVLGAELVVIPGNTYEIKIGVSDVADAIFDSGVFIGIESLDGDSLLVPPSNFVVQQDGNSIEFENESKYATSYFWDFGDGTTSTEKDPGAHVYDPEVTADYTLSLITQNYCCTDTFSIVISIEGTVDVVDPALASVEIFPNPVKDYFQITGVQDEMMLSISNAQGRIVHRELVNESKSIRTSEWAKGMYFVQLEREASKPLVKRLVVN
ncbi:MAG: T9SS type A sorting domain-containing protein [Saprospiraceae bacterium]|nr:T9SS type A sorting domain-containing protein [Saprospiraceae bacterium]